ncbi:MAG: spore protease YyaC [Bacillota bacterium]
MNTTIALPAHSINTEKPFATTDFANSFVEFLNNYYTPQHKDIVILCIGTDRSTGDSLGPLVGHRLEKISNRYSNVFVHGTLENPVHAKNLQATIDFIDSRYNKPFVVAIDACLGKVDRVGFLSIGHGPLKPGAGVNKELPAVGDIHITGIVNLGGFMEYIVLQNTRLHLVLKMANTAADGIQFGLWKLFKSSIKEQCEF